MKEKLLQVWQKIKAFFAKMSKKTRDLLIAVLAVVVLGAVAAIIIVSSRPYTELFTGLSNEDMASILTYLDENNVSDYRVQNNDTIMVPQGQEAALKASLLMAGYPTSGFGYKMYLNNVGSLSSESDRKTLFLFDLQDRMGAVVRCFDGVKDANVTIAQGEDRRYVLDSGNITEASAMVLITMHPGRLLTNQQADAIRNLIARGVQGLEIDNITISDTAGNNYLVSDLSTTSDASELKMALENKVNNTVRANVMQVLAPLFGEENLSVSVNSTVDISKTYGESVTYQEPYWASDGSTGGEGIIGSRVYDYSVTRGDDGAAGGLVGTESNSDLSSYVEDEYYPDGSETSVNASGEVNYNVDTHRQQTESNGGTITDVMVSISINSAAVDLVNEDSLIQHVARAAGIGSYVQYDKISILVMPFYETEASEGEPSRTIDLPDWAIYALIGFGLLLILLIIFLIVRARRKKKTTRRQQSPVQFHFDPNRMAQPQPYGADIMEMRTEKSMELRREVRQFAETNPEIAAQLVKTWLRGGEESNG